MYTSIIHFRERSDYIIYEFDDIENEIIETLASRNRIVRTAFENIGLSISFSDEDEDES